MNDVDVRRDQAHQLELVLDLHRSGRYNRTVGRDIGTTPTKTV
jgi:hypothetical protein